MDTSPSLQEQVVAALRRITRAIDLNSRLLLHRHGLTTPQLAALQAIRQFQPISVGRLARKIHLSPATVTGILGRLEKRRLVTRAMGDRDRRSVMVELTAEGVKLANEAPSLLQERFQQELAKLEQWEQTMILATLQRIATMMDADQIEAAPDLINGADTVVSAEDALQYQYLEKTVIAGDEGLVADESLS